jgi:CHAT domain-containing protein
LRITECTYRVVRADGRFHADNPLFSSLQLAEGPLTVYDLEALHHAPRTVILSACDAGISAVKPGNELMGLAAAVLALGTQTLVASVFPVPDEAIRPLMLALHAGLRAGLSPAAALARAQMESGGGDLLSAAAGAGLVCYGAGHRD